MKRLLLVFGVLLLLVSACGDDDDSGNSGSDEEQTDDTEPEEIALDDWVDDVNDVCADLDDDLDDVEEPEALDDFQTILDATEETEELASDAFDELEEIGLPDEDTNEAEDWLATWDDRFDVLDDLVAAAEDEDEDAVEEAAAEGEEIQAEADELAEELGIDECLSDDAEDDPGSLGGPDDTTDDSDDASAGGPMTDVGDLAAVESEIESDYTAQLGLAIDVTCESVDLATVSSFECEGLDEEGDVLSIEVTAQSDGTFLWEVVAVNGVSV